MSARFLEKLLYNLVDSKRRPGHQKKTTDDVWGVCVRLFDDTQTLTQTGIWGREEAEEAYINSSFLPSLLLSSLDQKSLL
jgi:hypothetical protein